MEREWIFGNIRVQVLTEEIVRVEVKNKACFEDRNTFFVPARHKFAGVPCVCGEKQSANQFWSSRRLQTPIR
jgi:hypothetical protein